MNLRATQKEKFVVTTDSNHNLSIYPNLLNRQFNVEGPNQVWVSDITYIWTLEGWVYLSSIMIYSQEKSWLVYSFHMKKSCFKHYMPFVSACEFIHHSPCSVCARFASFK